MYFLFQWFVKITGWLLFMIFMRPKTTYENKKIQSRRIKKYLTFLKTCMQNAGPGWHTPARTAT